MQATSVRPSSSQTVCRKFTRLPRESSRVRRMEGSTSRSGIPGNPAPVPTSTTDLPRKSARVSRAAQSRKCRVATSPGSVMAVRFMTLLVSSSSSAYRCSWGMASVGRPRVSRPCRNMGSICSIMHAPSKDPGSPPAALPPGGLGRGRRGLLLFPVQAVDGLYQAEHRKGHDEKVQNGVDEVAQH